MCKTGVADIFLFQKFIPARLDALVVFAEWGLESGKGPVCFASGAITDADLPFNRSMRSKKL